MGDTYRSVGHDAEMGLPHVSLPSNASASRSSGLMPCLEGLYNKATIAFAKTSIQSHYSSSIVSTCTFPLHVSYCASGIEVHLQCAPAVVPQHSPPLISTAHFSMGTPTPRHKASEGHQVRLHSPSKDQRSFCLPAGVRSSSSNCGLLQLSTTMHAPLLCRWSLPRRPHGRGWVAGSYHDPSAPLLCAAVGSMSISGLSQ